MCITKLNDCGGLSSDWCKISPLITLIMQVDTEIDPQRFELGILNNVFCCFLSKKPHIITKITKKEFEGMKCGEQLKNKSYFEYDSKNWTGATVKHKWSNNEDNQEWFTYSIKLPNDGYVYNKSYEKSRNEPQYLRDQSYIQIKDIIEFVQQFFEGRKFQLMIFYLTYRNRVTIEAKCADLRVWLQITFENGYPKEKVSLEWYDQDKLKKLLEDQRKLLQEKRTIKFQ
jgi:hypothetical protein